MLSPLNVGLGVRRRVASSSKLAQSLDFSLRSEKIASARSARLAKRATIPCTRGDFGNVISLFRLNTASPNSVRSGS